MILMAEQSELVLTHLSIENLWTNPHMTLDGVPYYPAAQLACIPDEVERLMAFLKTQYPEK